MAFCSIVTARCGDAVTVTVVPQLLTVTACASGAALPSAAVHPARSPAVVKAMKTVFMFGNVL
ncbi:hypothetical protein Ade02nite_08380 [Paractinoplanes deccanensis]|uniref:Uncharacterized protein n=1 Tax=Paractinoplanes deccanensis TaxID=113561 RepID=A0ABQ3XWT5_9ACTN|nr:hypothetical protein Ade02nite_08380 [Actinoplanes deccanensis]